MSDSRVLNDSEAGRALANFAPKSDLVLVARNPLPDKLRYKFAPVRAYLDEYCGSPDNDCEDGAFPSDCTHFVCHGLNKAGVFVKLPSADCKSGLCIRVAELAASFHASKFKYKNVTQLSSHSETQTGDYCFIPSWFGLTKTHVMVLAEKAAPTGARVWAHTENRCALRVEFEGQDCVYYRITATES